MSDVIISYNPRTATKTEVSIGDCAKCEMTNTLLIIQWTDRASYLVNQDTPRICLECRDAEKYADARQKGKE